MPMRTKKFTPYIRRPNGREKTDSMRVAIRLAFYRLSKRPFVVMVQKGFPNLVVDVAASRELQQSICGVAFGKMTFAQWARAFSRAQRTPPRKSANDLMP